MFATIDCEGIKVCHPFVARYDCIFDTLHFWLKKHPSSAVLPDEVKVCICAVDGDGKPYSDLTNVVTVEVPAGLTETGEELTAEFNDALILHGNSYGIEYYFPHQATAFGIIIAGAQDDVCPWESGGDSIPVIEADYSGYVYAVEEGPCVPSWYELDTVTGDAQVSCTGATNISDDAATLNCQVLTIPAGKPIVLRGMEWGLSEEYGSEWSEQGSWATLHSYSHDITGLSAGVKYYYRCKICTEAETTSTKYYFSLSRYLLSGRAGGTYADQRANPAQEIEESWNDSGDSIRHYYDSGYPRFFIQRNLIRFDTTGIPANAIITSATLRLYIGRYANVDSDAVFVNAETIPYAVDVNDWEAIGALNEEICRIPAASLKGSGSVCIETDVTGLTYINKGTVTQIAVMYAQDMAATQPDANNNENHMYYPGPPPDYNDPASLEIDYYIP